MFGSRNAVGKHLDDEVLDDELIYEQGPAIEPGPDLTAEERERAEIEEACEALVREGAPRPSFGEFVPAARTTMPTSRTMPATAGDIAAAQPDPDLVAQLEAARREADEQRAARADSEQQLADLRAELDAARAHTTADPLAGPPAPDAEVVGQLDAARREAAEYRASLADAQRQIAALRGELEASRFEAQSTADGTERDAATHRFAREDAEARVTALTAELEKVQASVAESASEFEMVVSELRQARLRLDELAGDRDRLSRELAAAVRRAESDASAQTEALQRTLEEQRAAYEDELARVRDSEDRQRSAADEARAALVLRQAEIDDLQRRLLESEQQRAEEAASLLSVLEQERGARRTAGWLD
ncbi:MAG TPA: hypothetical protein VM093_06865 [Aeromicrobium sp.]|nr:hypothetical protein [Aeromicrobium sp.]